MAGSPGQELGAVAPLAVGRVGERDALRIAAVPGILGEAGLLGGGLGGEWRQGWAGSFGCRHDRDLRGEGGAMADAPDFRFQAAWLTGTAGKSTSVPNTSLM
jgi:hypothetical protein